MAHQRNPVVMIGNNGLTEAVLREIAINLAEHELIKIRVQGDDREARVAMYDTICQDLDAAPVQHIGKLLVIYRPNNEVNIALPGVKVKPKPVPKVEPVKPDANGFCPVAKECPALTVRLDLIQQEEGRRVVASSPDGDIVGGIDIPIEKWIKRNENKWAAGVTYDTDKKPGAFLDRDLGPFRVGVEADAEVVRVRAGIRF